MAGHSNWPKVTQWIHGTSWITSEPGTFLIGHDNPSHSPPRPRLTGWEQLKGGGSFRSLSPGKTGKIASSKRTSEGEARLSSMAAAATEARRPSAPTRPLPASTLDRGKRARPHLRSKERGGAWLDGKGRGLGVCSREAPPKPKSGRGGREKSGNLLVPEEAAGWGLVWRAESRTGRVNSPEEK